MLKNKERSTMKLPALLALALLLAPMASHAFDVGPAVGAHIPTLVAKDETGAPRDLKSISGRKGVVLVFFRSAKWCPFCQAQLVSLKDVAAPLATRGYTLAAISYDPPTVLHDYAVKRDVKYTLLSDDGSKMIDAWNLRDPQYPVGSFAYGVPRPSIFVISPRGVIKAKLALEGYKVRPDNAAILAAVDGVK
jgi:peroxiredoxin